ncbi:MAG: hypothetical protein KJ042_01400 [Deltaproteobacteria bacterium]|nr:hypothetical protein [Deltaproteobacteria bacterium]
MTTRIFAVWVFAIAASLLCAACGGDDDDSGSVDSDGGGSDDDDAADDDDSGGTGEDRIANYLRPEPFSRLVFEIEAVAGYGPREDAMEGVIEFYADVIDKPGGIEAIADETIEGVGAGGVWTQDDLHALAESTANLDVEDDTIAIHLLYVDGSYDAGAGPGTVLGVAWGNLHLAIFTDDIDDSCATPLPFESTLCRLAEQHVLAHELGHVIGLVDNGLPMVTDHKDPTHGDHDVSDECLMYWAYEGTSIVDLLAARITEGNLDPLGFDDACLADIAAVRDAT